MSLRPFQAAEFDALWAAVAWADPTVAVGAMDPELLRSRVETSGRLTERELLLAIEVEDRPVGSIQGYRDGLPEGVFGVGIELFDEAGARRLEAGTADDNAAMRTVLERVGFRQEGLLRCWYPSDDGRGIDCAMYGMTKDDYDEVKTRWT